jgi:hypothetical protein
LSLSNGDIVKLIEGYEKESRALKDEALRMCWFMRGGVSYDDAMMLSSVERNIINDIIKENMEITKKSGLNFF